MVFHQNPFAGLAMAGTWLNPAGTPYNGVEKINRLVIDLHERHVHA